MKRRFLGNPVWTSLVMTVCLVVLQLNAASYIQQQQYRQFAIYVPTLVLAVFMALVAVYVGIGPRGALLHWGGGSVLLGFTGVAAGANLLLNSGLQAWDYYQKGIAPLPYRAVFNGVDQLFLHGTLIFGVLGGAGLLVLGLLWMFGGKPGSTFGQWLSLLPILWAFCRLARYVQSYSSTIRNAFSAVQAAELILSLMFFYMVGQHLNGRLKLSGMGVPVCAFAFGMIGVSAFVARYYLQVKAPDLVAGAVIVTDVTDLLNGVFALAVGAVACSKTAVEKTEEYRAELLEKARLKAIADEEKGTFIPLGEEDTAEEDLADVAVEEAVEEAEATEEAATEESEEEVADEVDEENSEEEVADEVDEENSEEEVEDVAEEPAEEPTETQSEETESEEE